MYSRYGISSSEHEAHESYLSKIVPFYRVCSFEMTFRHLSNICIGLCHIFIIYAMKLQQTVTGLALGLLRQQPIACESHMSELAPPYQRARSL